MDRPAGGPLRILLVEDDPDDQELTRLALQGSHVRNELHAVGDGEEALDFLLRRGKYRRPGAAPRPDLILLDLRLPKLDGTAVIARVRADPGLRRIPIVAFTGSRSKEDMARSYDLGVTSYVVKPSSFGQYVRTLQALPIQWLAGGQ